MPGGGGVRLAGCLAVLQKPKYPSHSRARLSARRFPGCYGEEPQRPPSRWQQPYARRAAPHSTTGPAAPAPLTRSGFADLKKGLSMTLLAQVPVAETGVCAIYRVLLASLY